MTPRDNLCLRCRHLPYHHENARLELGRCFYPKCRCRRFRPPYPSAQWDQAIWAEPSPQSTLIRLDRLPWDDPA